MMLILILHYKNFREKVLTGNELRKAAFGRKSQIVATDDTEAQQEVVFLDYALNNRSEIEFESDKMEKLNESDELNNSMLADKTFSQNEFTRDTNRLVSARPKSQLL